MKGTVLLLVIALAFAMPVPALGDGEARPKEQSRPTLETTPAPAGLKEQAPTGRTSQAEEKPQQSDVVVLNHRWATFPAETLPGEGPRFR